MRKYACPPLNVNPVGPPVRRKSARARSKPDKRPGAHLSATMAVSHTSYSTPAKISTWPPPNAIDFPKTLSDHAPRSQYELSHWPVSVHRKVRRCLAD